MPFPCEWYLEFLALDRSATTRYGALSLFDGSLNLTKALARSGLRAEAMDLQRGGLEHDLSTLKGQSHFLKLLSRLVVSGLCWLCPPCSNFIWISRSGHGPSVENPRGRANDPLVSYYNQLAEFVAKARSGRQGVSDGLKSGSRHAFSKPNKCTLPVWFRKSFP